MSDEISYLDFGMTVEKSLKDKYVVHAEFGDQRAQGTFVNPFNEDKRELINSTLTAAALRRTARTRASNAREIAKMKEFGATLFASVVTGPVQQFYAKSRSHADQQCKGIRWRLELDPMLEDLPWEFLCLRDRFLALDPRNPIVRYIKPDTWIAPLASEHPLRLLVVIASPKDEVPLNTELEKQRILDALKPLIDKGQVEVTTIEGPNTWEQLFDKLLPDETHILHFIGHGTFDKENREGALIMEDIDGKAARVGSEYLSVLMQGKSRLRLVVLNSCLGSVGEAAQRFSSVAAGMVRSGVPAVIAMQFEISDEAAHDIAETFYTALALNRPVDAALTEARRKIYLTHENSLEWATPILYMQVPDGKLFQFTIKEDTLPTIPEPETVNVASPPAALLVRTDTGQQIPLHLDSIKIGRGAENDVNLPDPTVSRRHAILTRGGSSYSIQDVAGSNGTRVNGEQIKERELRQNDLVRLGNVEVKFVSLIASESRRDDTTRESATTGSVKGGELVRTPSEIPQAPSTPQGIRSLYQRFNRIFEGGGATPAAVPPPSPSTAQVKTSKPDELAPKTNFESRLYEIKKPDIKSMAEGIRQLFFSKGFESQIIQQNEAWIVRGRKTGWLKVIKMTVAATVIIDPSENKLRVLIGGSGSLERGAAWATSLYIKPDWVNSALGVDQQKQLLEALWQTSESFITAHGGKRVEE